MSAPLVALLALAALLQAPVPAQAATCTVRSLDDSGEGTLRTHIADTTCDTIDFALAILPGTITLASQLIINRDVSIQGPGAEDLTISGNNSSRVFQVVAGVEATIAGVKVSEGRADFGGGIRNFGTLAVQGSEISGNTAVGGGGFFSVSGRGGGIHNQGTLTVEKSTISGNTASRLGSTEGPQGGGVYNTGTLTVLVSAIAGNSVIGDGSATTPPMNADGGGIYNTGTVTVQDSAVSDNTAFSVENARGGGIYNTGTLTMQNSAASDNSLTSGVFSAHSQGGGIYTTGNFTVLDSIISDNSATNLQGGGLTQGGGIYNTGGTVTVEGSAISGNSAALWAGILNTGVTTVAVEGSIISSNGSGGGIINSGEMTVTDSTISGNSNLGGIVNAGTLLTLENSTITSNFGDGIRAESPHATIVINSTISGNSSYGIRNTGGGTVTIENSTISGDAGTGGPLGLGIWNGGTVIFKNSIVGNSPAASCENLATFELPGINLNDDGACEGFTQVENLMLGPLADNGGPTKTHALPAESPAIDAVADCTDVEGNPVVTDQRGVARPQGLACDVGAFELEAVNQPPVADAGGPYVIDLGQGVTLDGTGSFDPDEHEGDFIARAEWDVNGDGTFDFTFDAVGPSPAQLTLALSAEELATLGVTAVADPNTGQPNYAIRLRVTDSFGRTDSASTTLTIVDNRPFPQVTRAAGANRFATAAEISMLHHPIPQTVDTVFVATGLNFPDALAGGVAAATTRSPLLLTSSVPDVTAAELDRLGAENIESIVILGGTAAVSTDTATTLSDWGDSTRLAGATRYETAIAISQHLYPVDGSADIVVVATGENFPDALAGATLASRGNGPVLLTQPTTLPQAVADEITRLDPDAIIVLGGPAAVSSTVLDQLTAIAPTGRIAGPNRYDTAVAISQEAFPDGAGVAYMAVGTNFPDALAGAAQAAASGSPVLLTPTDALPQAVIDEITRLDPHAIVILGGTAVISTAVENQLKALLGI